MNVVVSDTGVGMSAGEMEIALERFGQVENSLSSNNEGTGLGLPLVQSQMELHGGSFKLESQENVGTRASLLFPPERVVDRPAG